MFTQKEINKAFGEIEIKNNIVRRHNNKIFLWTATIEIDNNCDGISLYGSGGSIFDM